MPKILKLVLKDSAYNVCGRTDQSWNVQKPGHTDMDFSYEPGSQFITARRRGWPGICRIPWSNVAVFEEAAHEAHETAAPEPLMISSLPVMESRTEPIAIAADPVAEEPRPKRGWPKGKPRKQAMIAAEASVGA